MWVPDDSSSLCYYGARYLAPWLTRWISPDATGAVDGLNLYVYVGNNPLKYTIKNSVLAFNKLSLSAGYALTILSSLSYASGK
jgi:hypothetical protein